MEVALQVFNLQVEKHLDIHPMGCQLYGDEIDLAIQKQFGIFLKSDAEGIDVFII